MKKLVCMGSSLLLYVNFPLIWLFFSHHHYYFDHYYYFFLFQQLKVCLLWKLLLYLNMYKNHYPISFWVLNHFSPFSFFVNIYSVTIYLGMSYLLLQFLSMKFDFGIPLEKCEISQFCLLCYNDYLLRWMSWQNGR